MSVVSDIAVVFGGPSPEHDVSVLTGLQAARALEPAAEGRGVRAIYWSKVGEFHEVDPLLECRAFLDGPPPGSVPLRLVASPGAGFFARGGRLGRERRLQLGVVVNCCHGGPGEDGTLQGTLDLAGITYTGPTLAGAALGMDKLAFANVVAAAGVPVLARAELLPGIEPTFPPPYIVKPRFGGSSIGIEVVADAATAWAVLEASVHLRRGAVVEPYREDLHDLQVAARSWPALQLSAVERPIRTAERTPILGYGDKYLGGEGMVSAPRELPARISSSLSERLGEITRTAADLCGLRGLARFDFLSDGTDLYLNEVNTIPGSLAKYLWVDPEVPFTTLLSDLVAEAAATPSCRMITVGADGTALRSAGSIASKLG